MLQLIVWFVVNEREREEKAQGWGRAEVACAPASLAGWEGSTPSGPTLRRRAESKSVTGAPASRSSARPLLGRRGRSLSAHRSPCRAWRYSATPNYSRAAKTLPLSLLEAGLVQSPPPPPSRASHARTALTASAPPSPARLAARSNWQNRHISLHSTHPFESACRLLPCARNVDAAEEVANETAHVSRWLSG